MLLRNRKTHRVVTLDDKSLTTIYANGRVTGRRDVEDRKDHVLLNGTMGGTT